MANQNVEQAITLYLETIDLETPANTSAATRENASRISGESAASPFGNFDRMDFGGDVEIPRPPAQEDNSGIRPPIAPMRDILIGGVDRTDFEIGS